MPTLTLSRPPEYLPPLVAEAVQRKQEAEAIAAREAEEAERKRAAKARKRERQQTYWAIRRQLRELGVTVFDEHVPLKVGIHHDLVALLAGEFTPEAVSRFLWWHCGQIAYLVGLSAGQPQHDLDGTVVGAPAADQITWARELLRQHTAKRASIGGRSRAKGHLQCG